MNEHQMDILRQTILCLENLFAS